MIVEIWGGGRSIRRLLSQLGYEAYAYDYRARTLTALPEGYKGSGNLIAVHGDRLPEVQGRIRTAVPWERSAPRAHWQRASVSV